MATSDLTDILVSTPQRVFTLVDFITQNPIRRAAIERILPGDDMSMEKKLDMFIATGYGLFELVWTEGEGEKAGQGLWIKVNDPVTGEAKYKCTIDGAITNYLTVAEAGKGSDKASMEYHVKNRLAIRVPELALQLWRDSGLVNEGSEFETSLTTILTYADSEQLSKEVMRYGLIALVMPERFLSDQAFEELKRRVLPEGLNVKTYQKKLIDSIYKGWIGQAEAAKILHRVVIALKRAKTLTEMQAMPAWRALTVPMQWYLLGDLRRIHRLGYEPQFHITPSPSHGYVITDGALVVRDAAGGVEFTSMVESKNHNKLNSQDAIESLARITLNARVKLGKSRFGGLVLVLPEGTNWKGLASKPIYFKRKDKIDMNYRYWDVRVSCTDHGDGTLATIVEYKGEGLTWSDYDTKTTGQPIREGFDENDNPVAIASEDAIGGGIEVPVTIQTMGRTTEEMEAELIAMMATINKMYHIDGGIDEPKSEIYEKFKASVVMKDAIVKTQEIVKKARRTFPEFFKGARTSIDMAGEYVKACIDEFGRLGYVALLPGIRYVGKEGHTISYVSEENWWKDDPTAHTEVVVRAGQGNQYIEIPTSIYASDGHIDAGILGTFISDAASSAVEKLFFNINRFLGEVWELNGKVTRISLEGTEVSFTVFFQDALADRQGTFNMLTPYRIQGTHSSTLHSYTSLPAYCTSTGIHQAASAVLFAAFTEHGVGSKEGMIGGTKMEVFVSPVESDHVAYRFRLPVYRGHALDLS